MEAAGVKEKHIIKMVNLQKIILTNVTFLEHKSSERISEYVCGSHILSIITKAVKVSHINFKKETVKVQLKF